MDDSFRITGAGSLPVVAIVLAILLLIILVPLLVLGLAGAAFSRLGFSWIEAVAVIILMLAGYFVNIPVASLKNTGNAARNGKAEVFDAFSGEPVDNFKSSTTIAVNIGGCCIPVLLAGYLLYETGTAIGGTTLFIPLALCFSLVTAIVIALTRFYVPGGIRAPLIMPGLAAIACGVLLHGGTGLEAAVTAFAGGVSGILFGASFVALFKGRQPGIRQISVGGAGMFGPVFFCALLSALIA